MTVVCTKSPGLGPGRSVQWWSHGPVQWWSYGASATTWLYVSVAGRLAGGGGEMGIRLKRTCTSIMTWCWLGSRIWQLSGAGQRPAQVKLFYARCTLADMTLWLASDKSGFSVALIRQADGLARVSQWGPGSRHRVVNPASGPNRDI